MVQGKTQTGPEASCEEIFDFVTRMSWDLVEYERPYRRLRYRNATTDVIRDWLVVAECNK